MPESTMVVFSHLRWDYVWQRPQHIISRMARTRPVVFVEEPSPAPDDRTRLVISKQPGVTVVRAEPAGEPATFGGAADELYEKALRDLLAGGDVITWLYTPLALDLTGRLSPLVLVYDVMDDLVAFRNGHHAGIAHHCPDAMKAQHRATVAAADLVFTGGPSLHRGVLELRDRDVHLFRSGVDLAHWAPARLRRRRDRRTAGYVGVLDERIDFALLGGLAAALPDWDIELVGPVHPKIEGTATPRAANLIYRGQVGYDALPDVMSEFDVAIMPFARNAATRSISPTKTLEYFAAGLPVVSTPVRDVVDDYGDVVLLADTPDAFAAACRAAGGGAAPPPDPDERRLADASWEVIVARMERLLDDKLVARRTVPRRIGPPMMCREG